MTDGPTLDHSLEAVSDVSTADGALETSGVPEPEVAGVEASCKDQLLAACAHSRAAIEASRLSFFGKEFS